MTELSTTSLPEGLRERKKRRTREAIVAAARELFAQRGFDAVTVAEIARAADVTEKTVFNHFPAKEDLVLEHGRERTAALIERLRGRPAGTPIVAVFRRNTEAFIEHVEHGDPDELTFGPRLIMGSRSLRDGLLLNWEREAELLAPAIAEQAAAPPGDVVPLVVARTLAGTHRMIVRAGFERLLGGEKGARIAPDLREQARRAYDLLEAGLADYGA